MFEDTRDENPQNHIIVHFVENYNQEYIMHSCYNRDAHDLMYRNNFAPKILRYARAKETRYMAIIMEHINDATSFADYLKTKSNKNSKGNDF